MKFNSTFFVLVFGILMQFSNESLAQQITPADIAYQYLFDNKKELNLTTEDIQDYEVSDLYVSKHNGVTHVYFNQKYQNIEVNNALFNINILPNGEVLNYGNRYVSNLKTKVNATVPIVSSAEAVQSVIDHFEIETNGEIQVLANSKPQRFKTIFAPEGLALEPIPVELVYEVMDDGKVQLSWRVEYYQLDAQHWWNAKIDAQTGEVLTVNDQMLHCNFGSSSSDCNDHSHEHKVVKKEAPEAKSAQNFVRVNSYNVYPIPVQAPSFGDRELVSDPADPVASPFGWHDTNGVAGAEFTITRGNNVHAYQDIFDLNNSIGDEPDGGATLDFDFPLDLSTRRPYTQVEPAITNLFYWSNLMHDVWYLYGFDEVSGNFQVNNYGNGGVANDDVTAEGLDGSGTNNAVFGTGADGSGARMQMFLWTNENLPGTPDAPDMVLNSPAPVAGQEIAVVAGGFGDALPSTGITAPVILGDDGVGNGADLCQDIINGADLNGVIALIDRGDCQFGEKVLKAEGEGAIAAIVCQNVDEPPFVMGGGMFGGQVTIPSVMISLDDCTELKMHLNGLSVTLAGAALDIPQPGPNALDGDFDNGIIAHEYGHGISIRLTGGPSTGGCLNSVEQAGEGWSDWFAIVMTTDRNNTPDERRGVATYSVGQPTGGRGLRSFPYSRNMNINPDTYGVIAGTEQVHRVGSVWCAMIWDMYWDLVDEHSFDDDIYNGTGGNNIAMQLVMDGMKLQACNPSFIDSRDGILAADLANNGGENQCLIWRAFARRGLGFSATPGGNEAFDLPVGCDVSSTKAVDELERGVSVSPNPNDGIFSVDFDENITSEVTVQVNNVAGSLLLTEKVNPANGALKFDLSSYKSGVYLLQIKTDEASIIRKIIVH